MPDRQVCIDCGTLSPETETNYTLISSQFGWRLTRTRTADGQFNIEWRCPACWKDHKRAKQATDEARNATSSIPPPSPGRPLPSFPSRPPLPEEEPTLQRAAISRPPTPGAPLRPRTGPSSTPADGSPIPGRLPPSRLPPRR